MRTFFDPDAFAKKLVLSRRFTVVRDNDGCLMIAVFDDSGVQIGLHDTGLDGNADPAQANTLADRLVKSLKRLGVQAKRYDYELDPDEQWDG